MGAPRVRAQTGPDLGTRRAGAGAAVLDFAVARILRDAGALSALPAVLARLADAFGLRAAVAFQPAPVTVLAAYPPGAADPALLARIGAATVARRETAAADVVQVSLKPGSALVAYSVPADGRCLCALALVGQADGWDSEVRATAHAVAAVVAAQIRQASDMAGMRVRAERDRAQTERLNCLIAAAIPGVLITDEQGLVTNVSQSFGTMFGLEGPLEGQPAVWIMRRIAPRFADPAGFARRVAAVSRARQPMTGEQIQCADGRTIEGDYWPVLADGAYRGDIWLAWDMSDRKELEQQRLQALEAELAARHLAEQAQRQLAEQNERLRRIDEARNQFLAIVSHELRTPLTSIVSFSELIRSEAGGLTPEGVRFLDIIEKNADRLHRLVGDLLMLDRLEAGALPLDLAPVSIADLAAEAVRSAMAGAARQGIAIDIAAGQGPPVPGDQRRLLQVLDNLIANAVKFSHRGGRVRVSARYAGGRWRIDVADSGIGIPPDEAGQLFSRFVRASNARTRAGTGLGLSIVKVLVEMHGGHVTVHSRLGHGSTFSVFLPVQA